MEKSLTNIPDAKILKIREIGEICDQEGPLFELFNKDLVTKVVNREYSKEDYDRKKVIKIVDEIVTETSNICSRIGKCDKKYLVTNLVFNRKYKNNYDMETVIKIFNEIFNEIFTIDSKFENYDLSLITAVVDREYQKGKDYDRGKVIKIVNEIIAKTVDTIIAKNFAAQFVEEGVDYDRIPDEIEELYKKRYSVENILENEMKAFSEKLKSAISSKNPKDSFQKLNDVYEFLKTKSEKRDCLYNEDLRRLYVTYFSWAIPSEIAIDNINIFLYSNKCSELLEIGSGTGLWASLLQILINNRSGIQVIPTDNFSNYTEQLSYTLIERIDYKEAISKYNKNPNSCLFLCWPPYNKPLASYSLENFKGNYLIYIGAGREGANADSNFFDILESYWIFIKVEKINNWYAQDDSISYYSRKPVVDLMYCYTGILPEGMTRKHDNKYTGNQLVYIGVELFPDLNGEPTNFVAQELGASYVVDGSRIKDPYGKRRSKRSYKKRSKRSYTRRSKRNSKKRSKKRYKRRSKSKH